MILLYLVLTLLIQGADAVYCRRYYGILSTRFYCSGYCCGDSCCYYTNTLFWGGGRIAGAVVGSIIGLCILVAVIIFLVRICCIRPRTTGRVVHTGQPNVFAMTAVSGTTQIAYPPTQPVAPPPYPGAGAAYPSSYPQPGVQTKKY